MIPELQKKPNPYNIHPYTITIIPHKKNDRPSEKRTIHYFGNQKTIILNEGRRIAPEKFCKKIANIATQHQVLYPIVPVINRDCENLLNVSSSLSSNEISFNKDYVNQDDPQFLKFLVGHELGHRNFNTLENHEAQTTVDNGNKKIRYLTILGGTIMAVLLQQNNRLVIGILSGFQVFLSALITNFFFAYQSSITLCKQLELNCDEAAITIFGRTNLEKIAIAKEGIAYFEKAKKTTCYFEKIYALMNNFASFHPTDDERIANLKRVIKTVKKARKRAYFLQIHE